MSSKIHSSEVSSEVVGNTVRRPTLKPAKLPEFKPSKDNTRSRGWFMTIHRVIYHADTKKHLKKLLRECVYTYTNGYGNAYFVWQLEKGDETHKKHIQAFIYSPIQRSKIYTSNHFYNAHVEVPRSIYHCIEYCQKERTRYKFGPYIWGEKFKPQQGKRSDLDEVTKEIVNDNKPLSLIATESSSTFVKYHKGLTALKNELMTHRTERPKVVWVWGKAGTGKSKYCTDQHKDKFYIKDGTQWWDGYEQQEAIIIDDFDGHWPYRDFLRLLDIYPYQGQIKGGYVKINSPYIYITCEHHPKKIWDKENELNQVTRRLDTIVEKLMSKNDFLRQPKEIKA